MTDRHSQCMRRGFTLLELLVVVAIMALLMGATTAAYFGLGRGARMRGSINTLRGAIGLIRQEAILKGQVIELHVFEDNGLYGYYATNTTHHYQVGKTGYFPTGVRIDGVGTDSDVKFIEFQPVGSTGNTTSQSITLRETGVTPASQATVTVYPLTGLVSVGGDYR